MTLARAARALGRRGGLARRERLPAAERKRIAALGGEARLRSIRITRRMAANFRYAAAAAELRGTPARVKRLRAFAGPLPGIYSRRS
jgi:hypothetical protein